MYSLEADTIAHVLYVIRRESKTVQLLCILLGYILVYIVEEVYLGKGAHRTRDDVLVEAGTWL
jgi:hypothetical protein